MSETKNDGSELKHPLQPIYTDGNGTARFKGNAIVRHLLDNGGIDLNDIIRMDFTREDREQFAQLINYSLYGYAELSYVRDDAFDTAEAMFKTGATEADARIAMLEDKLGKVRTALRALVPEVFPIHPDDLDGG